MKIYRNVHQIRSLVASTSGKLFALSITNRSFGFTANILIAKVAGAVEFAHYTSFRNLIDILCALTRGGADLSATRLMASVRTQGDQAKYAQHYFRGTVRAAIAVALILILFSPILRTISGFSTPDFWLILAISCTTLLLQSLLQLCMALSAGLGQPIATGIHEGLTLPLVRIFLLASFFWGAWRSAASIQLATLIATGLSLILAARWINSTLNTSFFYPKAPDIAPKDDQFKRDVDTKQLSFNYLLSAITQRADIILITFLASTAEIASYNMALSVISLIGIVSSIQNKTYAPQISRLWSMNDREKITVILGNHISKLGTITISIAVILPLVLEPLLNSLGKGFNLPNHTILLAALLASITLTLNSSGYILTMTGNEKREFKILIFALPIVIASGFFGYYLYQICGMLAALLVATSTIGYTRLIVALKLLASSNHLFHTTLPLATGCITATAATIFYYGGYNSKLAVLVPIALAAGNFLLARHLQTKFFYLRLPDTP